MGNSVLLESSAATFRNDLLDDLGSIGASRASARDARRSDLLLEALPAAVYTTDASGQITFYNEAAADLWGLRPTLGKSAWCGSWRLYWPDGRPMRHDECPMAVALKEGRAIKGAEAVAERPDGTRVPFLAYPTPLHDEAGVLTGAINTLIDISDRKRTELAANQLRAIVDSADDAIVSKSLDGIIATWNYGAERLFGYTADEVIGKPITILMPPDRHNEEPGIIARIRKGERIAHYETVRRRKDGSPIEISLTVSPIKDAAGKVIGASKIARDITERRRAQEQLEILLREMNHRVKNLFALASGLVSLSARSARTPAELADAVRDRLGALARAHELTLPNFAAKGQNGDRATTLSALARTIVFPYVDPENGSDGRFTISGPDVAIGGSAVTSLALLLHEFATNAAKYGALSSPRGRVDIEWSVRDGKLDLTWRERGGPPLAGEPQGEGFGGLISRTTVSGQLDGQLSRDWRPEGLVVHLSASMKRLTP